MISYTGKGRGDFKCLDGLRNIVINSFLCWLALVEDAAQITSACLFQPGWTLWPPWVNSFKRCTWSTQSSRETDRKTALLDWLMFTLVFTSQPWLKQQFEETVIMHMMTKPIHRYVPQIFSHLLLDLFYSWHCVLNSHFAFLATVLGKVKSQGYSFSPVSLIFVCVTVTFGHRFRRQ